MKAAYYDKDSKWLQSDGIIPLCNQLMGGKGYTHQDGGYFEKDSEGGSNKEYIVPVGNMQNQSQGAYDESSWPGIQDLLVKGLKTGDTVKFLFLCNTDPANQGSHWYSYVVSLGITKDIKVDKKP